MALLLLDFPALRKRDNSFSLAEGARQLAPPAAFPSPRSPTACRTPPPLLLPPPPKRGIRPDLLTLLLLLLGLLMLRLPLPPPLLLTRIKRERKLELPLLPPPPRSASSSPSSPLTRTCRSKTVETAETDPSKVGAEAEPVDCDMLSSTERPMSPGDTITHLLAWRMILLALLCCARPLTAHLVFGHTKGSVKLGRVTTSVYSTPTASRK